MVDSLFTASDRGPSVSGTRKEASSGLNIRNATKRPTILAPLRPPKSVEISIERLILKVVKEGEALIFGARSAESHFSEIKSKLAKDDSGISISMIFKRSGSVIRTLYAKDYTTPFDLFMDIFRAHLELAVKGARSKLADVLTHEERKHRGRFAAAVKSKYGVDVNSLLSNKGTREQIDVAVQKSVALIRGLSDDMAKQVEFTILDAATKRESRTTLSERLRKVMAITRKRARLIAKDQTATFNGVLNQARQTQIGIDRYIWETMQDERVRHEHRKRHGRVFFWSRPPEDGHPGQPINCRCTAIPLVVDPRASR